MDYRFTGLTPDASDPTVNMKSASEGGKGTNEHQIVKFDDCKFPYPFYYSRIYSAILQMSDQHA